MSNFSLPTGLKPIQLVNPKTTNASITSDAISLKGAVKAWFVIEYTQAAGHATTPTLKQATDVAIGTNAAGPVSRIWSNLDTGTSDTLVERTAAASYALTTATTNMQVVFEIDPASLTDGYDVVYFTQATSSQATNFMSATAYIKPAFAQTTPPSAIVD